MAMTMNGEVQLAAPRETVWAKLNDAEVLKQCIPGCEELTMSSPTEFAAVATIKIGPVKARFKGKVHLTDMDPPNGYRISGEGEGGVAGFAKGAAQVRLAEKDGGTLLSYDVEIADRWQARPARTASRAGHLITSTPSFGQRSLQPLVDQHRRQGHHARYLDGRQFDQQ